MFQKFTGPLKFSDAVPTGRAFATLTPMIDPFTVGQRIGEKYAVCVFIHRVYVHQVVVYRWVWSCNTAEDVVTVGEA